MLYMQQSLCEKDKSSKKCQKFILKLLTMYIISLTAMQGTLVSNIIPYIINQAVRATIQISCLYHIIDLTGCCSWDKRSKHACPSPEVTFSQMITPRVQYAYRMAPPIQIYHIISFQNTLLQFNSTYHNFLPFFFTFSISLSCSL